MEFEGLVVKGIGGFYYVETADNIYECKARGIFRKEKISPFVGDKVKITIRDDGENTIDEIFERKNFLLRPPLANIDQLIIVISTCEPSPSTLIIDKLTVLSEDKGIEPIIVFTKSDLKNPDDLIEIYQNTGYKTFSVSSLTGKGVNDIKPFLEGKISAFTGNSGVGKSTLLNAFDSSLSLETGEISNKLGRGRHTTRQVELFKMFGGYIADTPGFSSIDIQNDNYIPKENLAFCFREFKEYLGTCKFSTCSHTTDKGCSILDAVKRGKITNSR
ncbi:MAG: ribosome small subunit-dependent GTPase A [Clostridiales bacterium]|nr:ribosome small subunit-dependent GTPase A [Clostridiales bacterium]